MIIPGNNYSITIEEIEGKISYFVNNSGRIALTNPMSNNSLR